MEALYYISMGFISLIENTYSSEDKRLVDNSFALYNPRSNYAALNRWMKSKAINKNLRLNKHVFHLTYSKIPLIHAIRNIECIGVIEYKMGQRARLTPHLLASSLFHRVPKELIDPKRNYFVSDKVIKLPKEWHTVDTHKKGLEIKVARAKFDTLLVKYRFTTKVMLFTGSMSDSNILQTLKVIHKRKVLIT